MKPLQTPEMPEASEASEIRAISPIPLQVFACCHCASTYFPARSLCAACGRAEFVAVDGEAGWIEQWTELHQSQRQKQLSTDDPAERQARRYLATVRTSAGPLVVAAMDEAGAAGLAVTLCHEGARLIARRKKAC